MCYDSAPFSLNLKEEGASWIFGAVIHPDLMMEMKNQHHIL
jgi:hypothetical protein